ncbi:right-handed parallel beta-helix repeat-containing protein [Pontibacter sp. E15-1]|uniref:right-handed parallel beta-helix repeat-containing protein n=1 Tax=Pontibacter sp. E15-1 TaxID=2919918 RepID=UPI001F4FFE2A|nr:right-handed parallel beta-helix repeat-containing protein [Pontibacter sp. E15-1]MCJ8164286.1 right-handed parallel beta-helix repeat-containing protein [Pontibacter sp. E15-1]
MLAQCLQAQSTSPKSLWQVRYEGDAIVNPKHDQVIKPDGFSVNSHTSGAYNVYVHRVLKKPVRRISFSYRAEGAVTKAPIRLMDAGANVLWQHDASGTSSGSVTLSDLNVHGQLVFQIGGREANPSDVMTEYSISDFQITEGKIEPKKDADGFVVIDNLTDLRSYATQDGVKVRLKPGHYQLDKAYCRQFIQFTGSNSVYDLRGANIMVDTRLFSRTDLAPGINDAVMYCAIAIHGDGVQIEGPYVETYGDTPGHQSRNKVFNLTGKNVTLKNAEIRTAGSNPWGYGSFYGLGGGDVRKMNGIRIAWPGENIKVIGCKVHMRAMGHAIFVQGAKNTLIEDCHVDGLLRTTNDILAETSGYAFDKNFKAHRGGYIEGVMVADDGAFLPGEMYSLSEDGIRVYPQAQKGANTATGSTTIKDCTVTNMRRGICTGLNTAGDKVINCKVTNCVAAGFNVGNADTLINCSADAKYAEAFCIPYVDARNAYVEGTILDSRGGMKNELLVKINGSGHEVKIQTADPAFIPEQMQIKLSTSESYGGPWDGSPTHAKEITLKNKTKAPVVLLPGTEKVQLESEGNVLDESKNKRKSK